MKNDPADGSPPDPDEQLDSLGLVTVPGSLFQEALTRTFGEDCVPDVDLREQSPADLPADRITELQAGAEHHQRYILKEEIGRGGMGAVLKIFDTDLRRSLAMKVILDPGHRSGSDTGPHSRRLLRFLEEAQITGQLDHPGIVPVHELGVDAEGRVYFTMRLVKGQELTRIIEKVHADKEDWNLTRALGVLLKTCEAMSYAHSKGVVHRDLKPSNIMVGRHGQVYVMDWGLARVEGREDSHEIRLRTEPMSMSMIRTDRTDTSRKASESPVMTMDGAVLGTPFFMPPEQAAGRIEEIGPHSDVYALGAMLYHLLTGRVPYHTPGDRVSPSVVLARVLQGPPTPIHELAPQTPPELEAICEKAMARDTSVRYADMSQLGDDLRAFLENRVVNAYRTGALIELKKWVSRNRTLAASLATSVLLILGGSIAATFVLEAKNQEIRGTRDQALLSERAAVNARQKAQESERRALQEKASAQEAEQLARQARESSERAFGFLVDQFQTLDQESTRFKPVERVADFLENAASSIQSDFAGAPLEGATLRVVIGSAYVSLELYEQAVPLLQQAQRDRRKLLGELDPDTISSDLELARAYMRQGRWEEAEPLLLLALTERRDKLGPQATKTLESQLALADFYLNKGHAGESVPWDETENSLQQIIDFPVELLGQNDPLRLRALFYLAQIYVIRTRSNGNLGKHTLEDAEGILRKVLSARQTALGKGHILSLKTLLALAWVFHYENKDDEAETLFREAAEWSSASLGQDHSNTLRAQDGLARIYELRNSNEEAEALYLDIIGACMAKRGQADPQLPLYQMGLTNVYEKMGRWQEAEAYGLASYIELRRSVAAGNQDRKQIATMMRQIYAKLIPYLRKTLGDSDRKTLAAQSRYASFQADQSQYEEAELLLNSCFERQSDAFGEDDSDTLKTLCRIAMLYAEKGQTDEALSILSEWLDMCASRLDKQDPDSLGQLEKFIRILTSQGAWSDAQPLARKLVEFSEGGPSRFTERQHMLEEIERQLSGK